MIPIAECAGGHRHECDRADHHGLRRAVAEQLRGTAYIIFRRLFLATMHHERAALYCAMDRGTSEVDGRKMALRIPAHTRKNLTRAKRQRASRGRGYLLQSFRSLSAIENTASAL